MRPCLHIAGARPWWGIVRCSPREAWAITIASQLLADRLQGPPPPSMNAAPGQSSASPAVIATTWGPDRQKSPVHFIMKQRVRDTDRLNLATQLCRARFGVIRPIPQGIAVFTGEKGVLSHA
ncbi:hypothetical protein BV20DRAFT_966146 [Pilatotrama ljubarskyi]|nr:hypothetical protein BV20DRAFT_966146 [Pilatotrama ljubarskyi]